MSSRHVYVSSTLHVFRRLIKQTGTSGVHKEFKEIEGYLSQIKEILAKANIPGLDLSQRQNLLEQLKRTLESIEEKLSTAEVRPIFSRNSRVCWLG